MEVTAPERQLPFLTLEVLHLRRLLSVAPRAKKVDPALQLRPAGRDGALLLPQVGELIQALAGLGVHASNIGRTTQFR